MSQSAAVSPATGAPTEREEWRRGGRTALFAALGYGTGPVLFLTTASVFVKPAMEATGWSTTQVLISPMLSVLFQLFGPLVGRLADRRGVKLTLTLGLIPYVVLLVLFATMPLNLVVYWGLGILMGFFGAYGFAIAWNRAVAVWFDKGAGKAFGVVGAGGAAAPILVIPLVTYVIYNAGWRTGYFVLAALTLLISLPAALFGLRTPPSETAQSTAKAQSGRKGKNATVARALKSARFWMLGLSMMVVTGAANAFLANMQPILLDGGLEVAVATSITTLFTAGVIVGRLGAGALLDLISRYWVAIGVFVLPGLGALTLVNVSLFPVAVVGAAALLVAFSQGAEADIVAYFMLKEYGKENFGTLYAWCFLLAGVGSLIMPYLFGGVRDLTGSYAGAVVVGCGCYLLGAVFIVANWVLARREQARAAAVEVAATA